MFGIFRVGGGGDSYMISALSPSAYSDMNTVYNGIFIRQHASVPAMCREKSGSLDLVSCNT